MSRLCRSPLSIAEDAFTALCAGPRPLALTFDELDSALTTTRATALTPHHTDTDSADSPVRAASARGAEWAGLAFTDTETPGRAVVAVDELRRWLRRAETSNPAKNAVWSRLISHAHHDGPAWVVGAVGMALPRLVRLAEGLADGNGQTRHELDAEILTGFLTALAGTDPATTAIFPTLLRASQRAARAWLRHQRGQQPGDHRPGSLPPPAPSAHPDLVLASCVRAGVITAEEADLIYTTRLDGVAPATLARHWGITPAAVRMRRRRAELRLAAALTAAARDADPHTDPCHTSALSTLAPSPHGATNPGRARSEPAADGPSYPRRTPLPPLPASAAELPAPPERTGHSGGHSGGARAAHDEKAA
jgi:hypothetical protein